MNFDAVALTYFCIFVAWRRRFFLRHAEICSDNILLHGETINDYQSRCVLDKSRCVLGKSRYVLGESKKHKYIIFQEFNDFNNDLITI
jgi:hypothetical protein